MPFNRPSLTTIYQRIIADMESRLTEGQRIVRVSLLGIVATGLSGAQHLAYGFLQWIFEQIFVDTAEGIGLTRWANIYGLPRKAPSYTTGTVSFTGVDGHTVATGTLIVNGNGYEYATQADYTINLASPPAPVEVEAVEEGANSNTDETTLSLSESDPNVSSDVTVESGFDDGRDLETEEAWILRLLQRLQEPPASGTCGDYVRWAQEISGVDKAWCIPLYAGGGTVGVVVSASDLQPVGTAILQDVEDYVDSVKPVPADVTYLDTVPLDTDYYISITPNTAAMQTAINEKLDELHRLESEPGGTLLLSHIRAAVSSAGPDDYEITDIVVDSSSIGVANIETEVPNAAVFSSATYASI